MHTMISCSVGDSSFHPRAEGGGRKGNSSVGLCGVERVNCTRKQNLVLEFTLLLLEISSIKSVCAQREETGLRLLTKLSLELADTFLWECCQEVLLAVLQAVQHESAHFQLQFCVFTF